jgi:hypothetical protein
MTQARIDRQNIRMNRKVQPMLDGNADMGALINALTPPVPTNTCDDFKSSLSLGPAWPWPPVGGGSPPASGPLSVSPGTAPASSVSATQAGVTAPASVAGSSPSPSGVPASGAPGNSTLPPWLSRRGSGWGYPGGRGDRRGFARGRGARGAAFGRGGNGSGGGYFTHRSMLDQLRDSISNFGSCPTTRVIAVPTLAPSAPVAAPAPVAAAPPVGVPAAPAVPGWTCPPQSLCRTGNVCLDMKRGCVMSSQVSLEQMAACSAAGYAGNEDFFPCLVPQGPNLPYLGTPMPNPPPYSSVASQDVLPPSSQNWRGLSGLGCGGGVDLGNVVGIALGVTAGLFFAGWLAKQGATV